MKKTLALIALAFAAVSAQAANTTYWGGNNTVDLLTIQPGGSASGLTFPYLSRADGAGRMDATELPVLTNEDDTTYNLVFNLTGNVSFSLDQAIYFNSVTVGGSQPTNYTIDLGEEGSITTAREFNIGNAHKNDGSFTLSADFSAATMAELISAAHDGAEVEFSRDLLVSKGNNGFWNLKERYDAGHLTFSSEGLAESGLVYAGIVGSADDILEGQYGLVYSEIKDGPNGGKIEKISLVAHTAAKTPEPATATLSLLALAGLAARRRRH